MTLQNFKDEGRKQTLVQKEDDYVKRQQNYKYWLQEYSDTLGSDYPA